VPLGLAGSESLLQEGLDHLGTIDPRPVLIALDLCDQLVDPLHELSG